MTTTKQLTPLKAIRAKCLDCMCGQYTEVKLCPSEGCPLYNFKMGRNPARKGVGSTFNHFGTQAKEIVR